MGHLHILLGAVVEVSWSVISVKDVVSGSREFGLKALKVEINTSWLLQTRCNLQQVENL